MTSLNVSRTKFQCTEQQNICVYRMTLKAEICAEFHFVPNLFNLIYILCMGVSCVYGHLTINISSELINTSYPKLTFEIMTEFYSISIVK